MTRFRFACRSHWHVLSGPRVRLLVEFLEARNVPSASVTANGIPLLTESEPSETADRATVLNLNNSIAVDGFIGHGSCGAADVDWYQFQLAEPSLVDLEIGPQPNNQTPAAVLTLYNSDIFTDTGDYDFFGNPGQFFENVYVGEPSLAQAQGSAALGEARILRELAPGTYYVAVSGAGNSYFNPFLADSGLAGAEGPYRLQITASDLSLPSSPQLLEAEGSPLLLRLDLSAPWTPTLPPSTWTSWINTAMIFPPPWPTGTSIPTRWNSRWPCSMLWTRVAILSSLRMKMEDFSSREM